MSGFVTLGAAFLAMMGAGGVGVALANVYLQRRREGVEHTPGEVVFDEMRQAIADLREDNRHLRTQADERDKLVIAQAQQLATLGEEVRQMREAAGFREEKISELKGALHLAEQRVAETEYELNEERSRRVELEQRVVTLTSQMQALQEGAA